MLTTTTHIPLDEFEHNPLRVFRRVTDERVTVVVEDTEGKQMVLRPVHTVKSTRRSRRKTKADYDALRTAVGSWKDEDIDTLLKNVEDSRRNSSRPPVEL